MPEPTLQLDNTPPQHLRPRRAWSRAEAEDAAYAALPLYGLDGAELEFLRLGEHAIFAATGADADAVLRVARPGIPFEHLLRTIKTAVLLAAAQIPVGAPAALPNADGPLSVAGTFVTAWRRHPQSGNEPVGFGAFGHLLRRLHRDGDVVGPLSPVWDPMETIRRRLVAARGLGAPADWITELRWRAGDLGTRIARSRPLLSTGVIHADAHRGNALHTPAGPVLIDLDDLSVGPRDADMAPTLVEMRRFGATSKDWVEFTGGCGHHRLPALIESPYVLLHEVYMICWLLQQFGSAPEIDAELANRIDSLDDVPGGLRRWSER